MIQELVIIIVLVAISVFMLGINIFLFRRKFPETEVGRNKDMIRLGLRCPKCEERKTNRRSILPRAIDPGKLQPDWSSLVK